MGKLSKKDLVELSKKIGYFENDKVKKMYARSNGNFYYVQPPSFIDDHDTFEITKEDAEGKSKTFPLNAAETIERIETIETEQDLMDFIGSDLYSDNENRSTVLKALDAKTLEFQQS